MFANTMSASAMSHESHDLSDAVVNGQPAQVLRYLCRDPWLLDKALPQSGETPLYLATTHNKCQIIEMLLKSGANPSTPGRRTDMTPLVVAVCLKHLAAVQTFMQFGAQNYFLDLSFGDALNYAASLGHHSILRCLLELRWNKDRVSSSQDAISRALQHAVSQQHSESVRLLLSDSSCLVNQRVASSGMTPLALAAIKRFKSIMPDLLAKGGVVHEFYLDDYARNYNDIVHALIDVYESMYPNPLHPDHLADLLSRLPPGSIALSLQCFAERHYAPAKESVARSRGAWHLMTRPVAPLDHVSALLWSYPGAAVMCKFIAEGELRISVKSDDDEQDRELRLPVDLLRVIASYLLPSTHALTPQLLKRTWLRHLQHYLCMRLEQKFTHKSFFCMLGFLGSNTERATRQLAQRYLTSAKRNPWEDSQYYLFKLHRAAVEKSDCGEEIKAALREAYKRSLQLIRP